MLGETNPGFSGVRMPSFGGGTNTRLPASTEDCKDVGGSIVGCSTCVCSETAKSRAADWPGKPSFTPVVLVLSLIASVEGGTARDPVPFPRDTASASLLRAVRDFCWIFSLSMKTTKTTNKVRALQAIQDNKYTLWLRGRVVSNKGPAAWIQRLKSLALEPGHRHSAAGQTPQPPFAALHIVLHGEIAGMFLADHELTRCASIRCKHGGDFNGNTRSNPVPKCQRSEARCQLASRGPCDDHLAKSQGILLQVDAISRT